jgi:mono/diheme cytochrome c family protein
MLVMLLAGCGGGNASAPKPSPTPTPAAGSPNVIDLPAPAGTEEGQRVATRAGCLACHTIGGNGNDGPGPDLTRVGARLDRAQIERALVAPEPPMPSFKGLDRVDLDALVDYLAELR